MYSNPKVIDFIEDAFVPVRVHVKQQESEFKRLGDRFGAHWTPTILTIDANGQERHRIEGFLPVEEFLPQLALARAHANFAAGDHAEAARLFDEIVRTYGDSEAAPEAQYWAGVSRYKATGDPAALSETAGRFTERYRETSWAKKSSVWR